uniref:Titin n=1 Tax=Lygus hesperus TaxID=30085 RepID=A0A0A9Y8L9_LYGHE
MKLKNYLKVHSNLPLRKLSFSFEDQKVLTISTVETEERETKLSKSQLPEGKTAKSDIFGHDVAEKFEIETETAPTELLIRKPESTSAQIEHNLHSSLIQTEVIVREGEVQLQEARKKNQVIAEVLVEQTEGISVSQVQTELRETTLTIEETPSHQKAQSTLIPQQSLQQTVIDTSIQPGVLERENPIGTTAQPLFTPLESVEITQGIIQEQEEQFTGTFKAKQSMASVEFEESKGVTVSQVLTEQKEQKLEEKSKPSEAKAKPELVGQEVAEQSQVIPQAQTEDFESMKPKEAYAQPEQMEFESVIHTEAITGESEVQFEDKMVLTTKKAKVVADIKEGITVTQTTAEHKEEEYSEVKQVTSTAASDFFPQEALQQSEALVSISTLELGPLEKPKDVSIMPSRMPFESVETSEVKPEEKEKEFSSKWKPDTSSAETSFQETKSLIVTQVTTHDREEEVTLNAPQVGQARPDVLDQEVAMKTEIIPGQNLGDLDLPIPIPLSAKPSTPIQQHVTVTTHEVAESETDLPELVKPSEKSGQLNIQEHSGNVLITEVQPNIKEGECVVFETLLNQQTSSVEFVTNTAYSSEQILCDVDITSLEETPRKLGHATQAQTEQDALQIQTSTLIEKEGKLSEPSKPETKQATVTIDSTTLASVEQQDVNETETPLNIDVPTNRKATQEMVEASSTQVYETEILDSSGTLSVTMSDTKTVDTKFLPNESIIISEQHSEEVPQSLSVSSEPNKTSAIINIPQTYPLSVDETHTHETVEAMQPDHQPATKNVQMEFMTHQNTLMVEDLKVDDSLGNIPDDKSIPITASESLPTHEVPIVQQVILGEDASDLFVSTKPTEFNASPTAIPRVAAQTEIADLKGGTKDLKHPIEVDQSQALIKLIPNQVFTTQDSTLLEHIQNLDIHEFTVKSARTNILAREIAVTEETHSEQLPDTLKTSGTIKETASTEFIPQTSAMTEEVIIKEQTKKLEERMEPSTVTANSTFVPINVAMNEEQIGQNTVKLLEDEKKKSEIAHTSIDGMGAVETTSTMIHDGTEEVDVKSLQFVTAKRKIDAVDSLQLTEVQVQESSGEYTTSKSLRVTGEPKVESREVATTEETNYDVSLKPLRDMTIQAPITASENYVGQNVLQQESTLVQETTMQLTTATPQTSKLGVQISAHEFTLHESMTAVQQDTEEIVDETPKSKRAAAVFEPAQTITVDTSTPFEQEDTMSTFLKKEVRGVNVSVNKGLKVPLTQMTDIEDDFAHIKDENPEQEVAKSNISTLGVATKEEAFPHQTATDIKEQPAVEEIPKTSVTSINVAITEESIVQCSTEELTPQATKRSVNADGDLIPHQVAMSEDVLALEEAHRTDHQLKSTPAEAVPQLQPLESVQVDTTYVMETTEHKPIDKVDQIKANTDVIELNLPLQQSSEIFESEQNIETKPDRSTTVTQRVLEGLQIATTSETLAEHSVDKSEQFKTKLATADQKLTPTDVLTTDEVITQETVKEFTVTTSASTNADKSLIFNTSLVTEEAEVQSSVVPIKDESMTTRRASTQLLLHSAIQTEEVTVESDISKLQTTNPQTENIGEQIIEQQALVTQQTEIQQDTQELGLEVIPLEKRAEQIIMPSSAVCTQDVLTHVQTTDIPEDQHKPSTVSVDVIQMSAPTITQHDVGENIPVLEPEKHNLGQAAQDLLPHQHVEIHLPNVLHSTNDLKEQEETAVTPKVDILMGLPIAEKREVGTHEGTEDIVTKSTVKKAKTQISIDEHTSTSVEQTMGEDSLGRIPEFARKESTADINIEGFNLATSETISPGETSSLLTATIAKTEDATATYQPDEQQEPTVHETVGEFTSAPIEQTKADIQITKAQNLPEVQEHFASEQVESRNNQQTVKRHSKAKIYVEGLNLTVQEEIETEETSYSLPLLQSPKDSAVGAIQTTEQLQQPSVHEIVGGFNVLQPESTKAEMNLTKPQVIPQVLQHISTEQVDLQDTQQEVRRHSKASINIEGLHLAIQSKTDTGETSSSITSSTTVTEAAVQSVQPKEHKEPITQELASEFTVSPTSTMVAEIKISKLKPLPQVEEHILQEQTETQEVGKAPKRHSKATINVEGLNLPLKEQIDTEETSFTLSTSKPTKDDVITSIQVLEQQEPSIRETVGEFSKAPLELKQAMIGLTQPQVLPEVHEQIQSEQVDSHVISVTLKRKSKATIDVDGLTVPLQVEVDATETSTPLAQLPERTTDSVVKAHQPAEQHEPLVQEIAGQFDVPIEPTKAAQTSLTSGQSLPQVQEMIPSESVRLQDYPQTKRGSKAAINVEGLNLTVKQEVGTSETPSTLQTPLGTTADAIESFETTQQYNPTIQETVGAFTVSAKESSTAEVNITKPHPLPQVQEHITSGLVDADNLPQTTKRDSKATINVEGLSLPVREEIDTQETPSVLPKLNISTDGAITTVQSTEQEQPSVQEVAGEFTVTPTKSTHAKLELTKPHALPQIQQQFSTGQVVSQNLDEQQKLITKGIVKIEGLNLPSQEIVGTEETTLKLPQLQSPVDSAIGVLLPHEQQETTAHEVVGEFGSSPLATESADIHLAKPQKVLPLVEQQITSEEVEQQVNLQLVKRDSKAKINLEGLHLPISENINTGEFPSTFTKDKPNIGEVFTANVPKQLEETGTQEIVEGFDILPIQSAKGAIHLTESKTVPQTEQHIVSEQVKTKDIEKQRDSKADVNVEGLSLPISVTIRTGETLEDLETITPTHDDTITSNLSVERQELTVQETATEFDKYTPETTTAELRLTKPTVLPQVTQLIHTEQATEHEVTFKRKDSKAGVKIEELQSAVSQGMVPEENLKTLETKQPEMDDAVEVKHTTESHEITPQETLSEFDVSPLKTKKAQTDLTKLQHLPQVEEQLISEHTVKIIHKTTKRDSKTDISVEGLNLPLSEVRTVEESPLTLTLSAPTTSKAILSQLPHEQTEPRVSETASQFDEPLSELTTANVTIASTKVLPQVEEQVPTEQVDTTIKKKLKRKTKGKIKVEGLVAPLQEDIPIEDTTKAPSTSPMEITEATPTTQEQSTDSTITGETPTIEEVATEEIVPEDVPASQLSEPIVEEPEEQEDVKATKKKKSIKKKPSKPEEPKPVPTPKTEETPAPEKPVEIKPKKQPIKLQPMKIERKVMESQQPQFAVSKEEVPSFTSVKLRKSSVTPKKEAAPVKLPTFLLKSRIKRVEYPPTLHHLTITQMEPVEVDKGILSRNYEEALKVKKKKVKKIKLSDIETAEKEEYIPYEEEKPDKVEETPETKSMKLPKEKPIEETQEPIKIKLGRGQVPKEEVPEEKVTLKKQPKKPEDVTEEVVKVSRNLKPEEPLQPTEPEEATIKLKPLETIETRGPEELDKPDEVKPEEFIEKKDEPEKKKKPKPKAPKEEEKPEEKSFPLGKGKKPEDEPEPEIKLRKKQGSPTETIPEPITLKPFDKEKPSPEELEKKLTGPKPEPTDISRPEEEIRPKEFAIDDKQKKKKKVKKPEKDEEIPEIVESEKPEVTEPEKPKTEKPRMKLQRLEKVDVVFEKPRIHTAVLGIVEGPFSVKLRRVKVEKVGEEPNVLGAVPIEK